MTLAGVVPLGGFTASQVLPLITLVVNGTAEPVLLRTETLCEEGKVPPC